MNDSERSAASEGLDLASNITKAMGPLAGMSPLASELTELGIQIAKGLVVAGHPNPARALAEFQQQITQDWQALLEKKFSNTDS